MTFALGVLLVVFFLFLFVWSCTQAFFYKNYKAPFVFLLIFLPFYLTVQIFAFEVFGNSLVIGVLKFLKEFALVSSIISWLMYQRSFLDRRLHLNGLDYVMLIFLLVPFVFLFLPVGEAVFSDKLLYYKGFVLIGLSYLGGRVLRLNDKNLLSFWRIVFGLILMAAVTSLVEFFTNQHFQNFILYNQFQQSINDLEPTGNYGLTWTFEASSGAKRFAAFFASPLEFAPAVILPSAALIYSIYKPELMDRKLAIGLLSICILCLGLAYSRAAMLGFILMCLVLFYVFGNRQLLAMAVVIFSLIVVAIFMFSSEDFKFFIIDTFTFSESSSQGHLIEWIIGIDSIINNPMGIGLAMSGNAQGVDETSKLGGENQFIIYGVQMGIFYIGVYILLLYYSIRVSFKAFNNASTAIVRLTFIAIFGFKIAFLVPGFFANVENYLYVSLVSWFLVGYANQFVCAKNLSAYSSIELKYARG